MGKPNFFQSAGRGLYGPSLIAISFRDLGLGLTSELVVVERMSDNNEEGFYLSGGSLDTAAILSYLGGADGRVKQWANQGTWGGVLTPPGSGPLIATGGSMVTENGNTAISFPSGELLDGDWTASEVFPSNYTGFATARVGNAGGVITNPDGTSSTYAMFKRNFGNMQFRHAGTVASFAQTTVGQQYNLVCFRDGGAETVDFTFNGSDLGSQSMDNDWVNAKIRIGTTNNPFQEFILMEGLRSDIAADIIADQNAYYSTF